MYTDPPPSRASPLPQLNSVASARCGLAGRPLSQAGQLPQWDTGVSRLPTTPQALNQRDTALAELALRVAQVLLGLQ